MNTVQQIFESCEEEFQSEVRGKQGNSFLIWACGEEDSIENK